MRPQKIDDDLLFPKLFSALRSNGYAGTSIKDLEEITGLKKASLYHRFPSGKRQIGASVLNYVLEWNKVNIYNVAHNNRKTPEERLNTILHNIRELYDDGRKICILRAMTLESTIRIFPFQISKGFQQWIDAFTALGLDFGYQQLEAEKMATEVLVRIQGSLIVAKGLSDLGPFIDNLSAIKEMYVRQF